MKLRNSILYVSVVILCGFSQACFADSADVSTLNEFKNALEDSSVTDVNLQNDLDYSSDSTIEFSTDKTINGKDYLVQDGDIVHFRFAV